MYAVCHFDIKRHCVYCTRMAHYVCCSYCYWSTIWFLFSFSILFANTKILSFSFIKLLALNYKVVWMIINNRVGLFFLTVLSMYMLLLILLRIHQWWHTRTHILTKMPMPIGNTICVRSGQVQYKCIGTVSDSKFKFHVQ